MIKKPLDPGLLPPYAASPSAWVWHEIVDHLWPWSRHGLLHHKWLLWMGAVLALLVSAAWVAAGMGRLSAGGIIGWWVAWSVFEILIRMASKPYIKQGPWWQRNYSPASLMDMLCYVSFKNLLVGATLFLGLKVLGLLQM